MKYSSENEKKVDNWLNDPQLRDMVEKECGTPIKVKVLWESGTIDIRGPLSGRIVKIKDILDIYGPQHLN